jgi:hypothetical protein
MSFGAALACVGTMSASGCGSSGLVDASADTGGQDAAPDVPLEVGSDTGTCDGGALTRPTFAPPGPATFATATEITISDGVGCSPMGTQIYYSTSGAVPTATTGNLYDGPIQIAVSKTVIAIAHDPSGLLRDSPPASAVYTVDTPD